MHYLIAGLLIAALMLSGVAVAQTFFGNCTPPSVLGFQLGSPYGVYCYPPPAGCTGGALNFTDSCNIIYVGGLIH